MKKDLVIGFLVTVIGHFLFSINSLNANTTENHWLRAPSHDNLIFTNNLLWSLDSNTKFRCAEACVQDSSCTRFTWTKVTSSSVRCRGHSDISGDPGAYSASTRLYVQTTASPAGIGPYYLGSNWLTKACTSNTECSQVNAECFSGQCLCTPGYYFCTSLNSCHRNCSNLQQSYVMYPGYYIANNNMNSSVTSLANCSTWCLQTTGCVSYEYSFTKVTCYLSAFTALDLPADWNQASSNLSSWQRTCA